MGTRTRSRPDESRKPGKITAEGYARLRDESGRLWNVERPRVRDGVTEAAAEGDRSENAEYIYGKMKLASIDRKLKFLGNRLEVLEVVSEPPPDDGRVHFASWVKVERDDGHCAVYRIVGSDETDVDERYISAESPVGRALLGKEVDDEVPLRLPKGEVYLTVLEVSVKPFDPID